MPPNADTASPASPSSFVLAAPSFVLPAGVPENCRFLAPMVDEIGLVLFESAACLAYGQGDLPPWLAGLPVSYHVHLPLDLDWADPGRAFAVIAALVEKTAFLQPTAFVLHPDANAPPARIAQRFAALGVEPGRVLLENTRERSLAEDWPALLDAGLSACLDLGHVLAYSQHETLGLPGLWGRVRMVHAYAPDQENPSRHAGLQLLDAGGRALLREALARLAPGAVLMAEVFHPEGLAASLEVLASLGITRQGERS
jgi:hypothetical protein